MHEYLIKYACIFTLTCIRRTPSLNKNKKKYACIYNKHAQKYTKYAQNGAFTNGTPYSNTSIRLSGDRYRQLYRVSPKIRPSPNFKNDFNISPTLKIRPRR